MPNTTLDTIVQSVIVDTLGTALETNVPLMEAGLDSLTSSEFMNALSTSLSVDIAPTSLFDHPTLDSITSFISLEVSEQEKP